MSEVAGQPPVVEPSPLAAVLEPSRQAAVLEPSQLVAQILQQHLSYLLDQCSCAHCGRIYTHGLLKHEQACQRRHGLPARAYRKAVTLDLEAEAEGETEAEAEGETETEVGAEAETESTAESAESEFQSLAPGAPCATTGVEPEVSSSPPHSRARRVGQVCGGGNIVVRKHPDISNTNTFEVCVSHQGSSGDAAKLLSKTLRLNQL